MNIGIRTNQKSLFCRVPMGSIWGFILGRYDKEVMVASGVINTISSVLGYSPDYYNSY